VSGSLQGVVATSEYNAWAVGDFVDSSGLEQTLVEHWKGHTWQIVPGPTHSSTTTVALRGVAAAPHDEDVWAVGDSEQSNSSFTLVEAWNGSTWRIVPSPTP
jgi:acyl-coenzyme A synthetase/AMP-(fatty) acid ligase